jgi:hypothetical protein
MSEENNMKYLEYWLHSIQSKVPKSYVIIVGTHIDIKRRSFPNDIINSFQHKKEKDTDPEPLNIKTFAVSCKTGEGISELKNYISELSTEKQISIPISYSKLSSILSTNNEKYLKMDDLLKYLENNNFKIGKNEIKNVIGTLHNLGHLLYYPQISDYEDIVILKPQWLIDIFKAVVTINEKFSNLIKSGWLFHNITDLLWPNIEKNLHHYLLKLLHLFQIAIPSKEKSLIPCRLEKAPK